MTSFYDWQPVADIYDPIAVGSIDATDTEPHDHAIIRALNSVYKPNKGVEGDPERTIFVGRLNHTTDEAKLKELFDGHGRVEKCRLVRDIVTGSSKGYAFIEYAHRSDARAAIHNMNHKILDDRRIIVMFECERVMSGWVPRRLGGGFGGRKESGQLRFGGVERPFRRPIIVP
ncbi:hypothetical protein HELRODRAFT_88458, partial [Helobdella robusta]|uniref:U11/U12 small nuclear ribonucleoprotein 35 kDa protein n=1 Tax=Helobdella robusta TaxID=6412 RepID=T1G729_HELRO